MTNPLYFTHMDSPVGALLLAGEKYALHYVSFPGGNKAFSPQEDWIENAKPFDEVKRQLGAYFAGKLEVFDLPLKLKGTAFQKKIWQALPTIEFGKTKSYGWLAQQVDSPKASRAVGAANGANPIPIILPCHRVIGANGALTGFGGGLPTKKFLLELEGVNVEGEQLNLFSA